ncbi:uncharacterized protein LOC106659414 [Trichogramma pretiosum]|uniref:uncharacterized protein LOC106659414 n=1 Tax=Trichogramma pretiosum TaxID=7493 RepID=UPI0006C9CA0F|nr:uncharacterized protein LOC106659414 [Trichogramma pretiosum]
MTSSVAWLVLLLLVGAASSRRIGVNFRFGDKPTVNRVIEHDEADIAGRVLSVKLDGSSTTRKGQLAYMICDDSKRERKCRVIVEDYRHGNRTISKSCELVLTPEQSKRSTISDKFDVTVVRDDFVVVTWYEQKVNKGKGTSLLRLTKLQLNDCRSKPIDTKKVEHLEAITYGLLSMDGQNVYWYGVGVNPQRPRVYFSFGVEFDKDELAVNGSRRWMSLEKFGRDSPRLEVRFEPVIKTLFFYPIPFGFTLLERVPDQRNSSLVTDRIFSTVNPGNEVKAPYATMEHPADHGITFNSDQSYSTLCNSTRYTVNCSLDFTLSPFLNALLSPLLWKTTLDYPGPEDEVQAIRDLAVYNTEYGPLLALGHQDDYTLLLWRPVMKPQVYTARLPRPNCDEFNVVESGLFENENGDYCVQTLCRAGVAGQKFTVSVACIDYKLDYI